MIRYASAIFLGSFLLFLVQPMLARQILPWYGGSPTVWTTCMLFFQVFLLGGYLYAHWLGRNLSTRSQAGVHLSLLALSLAFLPITPSEVLKPVDSQNPVGGILLLLLITVGLPYLIVSSSNPLLQNWLKSTHPRRSPYRLFALSNLGSLLGLLVYPFLLEPLLLLGEQTWVWSIAYGFYAVLCGWCALGLFRNGSAANRAARPARSKEQAPAPATAPTSAKGLWLALAACGSVMLLATTNHLCENVAVVPFLWVLPLSLYLLSFIISFQHESWYDRRIWVALLVAGLAAVVILLKQTEEVDLRIQILVYSTMLFAACMVAHGELARAKPPAPQLTSFYLVVAAGGALGGLFVGLAAPNLFKGYWEFPLALLASYLLAATCVSRDKRTPGARPQSRLPSHLWAGGAWVLIFLLGSYIYRVQANTLAITFTTSKIHRPKSTWCSEMLGFLWNGRWRKAALSSSTSSPWTRSAVMPSRSTC